MKKQKDKIEQVKQAAIAKQQKHVGRILHTRGLTVFEFNLLTYELAPAKFSEEHYNPITKEGKRSVIAIEGCIYKEFLNQKSAKKGFAKLLNLNYEKL